MRESIYKNASKNILIKECVRYDARLKNRWPFVAGRQDSA